MNTRRDVERGWWLWVVLAAAVMALLSLSTACEPGEVARLAQLQGGAGESMAEGTPIKPGGEAASQAWIEYPLEGQTVPLEALTFVVFATDAEGVTQVDLVVNGSPLPGGALEEAGDGRGLVLLRQEWVPDREGKYIVEARGRNPSGRYGEPTFVSFCVVTCRRNELERTPDRQAPGGSLIPLVIPTDTPALVSPLIPVVVPTDTPTPTRPPPPDTSQVHVVFTADRQSLNQGECTTLRWSVQGGLGVELDGRVVERTGQSEVCPPQTSTYQLSVNEGDSLNWSTLYIAVDGAEPPALPQEPAPGQPSDVRFWAENEDVSAGSCTTLHWHVTNVRGYWLNGQAGAGDDGSLQTCPCQTETHTLHVVKADNSEEDYHVTVHVSGECTAPPSPGEPPSAGDSEFIDGEMIPADLVGPDIGDVDFRTEGLAGSGCRVYARTSANDTSGVSWVRLHFQLGGGGWNTVDMVDQGGGIYDVQIPGASGGESVLFKLEASDSNGWVSETGSDSDDLPSCPVG